MPAEGHIEGGAVPPEPGPGPSGAARRASLPLLVAVTMTGTLALHVFVPALPSAARDLGASALAAQLTLTLFLCGLAVGQLVYGPVSDRFGRRPVLLASLTVYLLGLLLAIPAASIGALVAARVVQSLGACGGLVLGRAMIRDTATPEKAAGQLAVLVMCMTLTPALAPALGGAVDAWLGWRAIFAILAGLVFLLLVLVAATLPETRGRSATPAAPEGLFAAYLRLLASRPFRLYLLAGSCSGTSLYAFLAAAPFLYTDLLRRSPQEVGLFCVIVSGGMVTGAALVRAFLGRLNGENGRRGGNAVSVVAAFLLLGFALAGEVTVWTLTATMTLYGLGVGVSGPLVVAAALNVDPRAAGSASGLYGFSQMAFGALFTLAVGLWHDGTALPLAVVLCVASGVAALALQRA